MIHRFSKGQCTKVNETISTGYTVLLFVLNNLAIRHECRLIYLVRKYHFIKNVNAHVFYKLSLVMVRKCYRNVIYSMKCYWMEKMLSLQKRASIPFSNDRDKYSILTLTIVDILRALLSVPSYINFLSTLKKIDSIYVFFRFYYLRHSFANPSVKIFF